MIGQPQLPGADQLPTADEVSGALREILADPDFATFPPSPWQQFLSWVWDTLVRGWQWLQRLVGEDGTGVAEVIVVVVALAALLVIARVAMSQAQRFRRPDVGDDEDPAPDLPLTAGEWFGTASRRAGRGEFRPAATALYQAFLLSLEQQGALSFHGSKTPGDYAVEIAGRGAGARKAEGTGLPTGAGRTVEAGNRFLDSFQDFSFGHDEPTPKGYAELTRIARDAGCVADVSEMSEPDAPGSESEPR